MSKRTFILAHAEARRRAIQAVQEAAEGFVIEVREPTRSKEANAAMWPILDAFSKQLDWQINGGKTKLNPDEWKDLLTAAFNQEVARVAPGLDGGMVLLGQRTSKFTKQRFSDWLEFLNATAAARNVNLNYTNQQ